MRFYNALVLLSLLAIVTISSALPRPQEDADEVEPSAYGEGELVSPDDLEELYKIATEKGIDWQQVWDNFSKLFDQLNGE